MNGFFSMEVQGNSMSPDYMPGDAVCFCQHSANRDSADVLVQLPGSRQMLMRLKAHGDGTMEFFCLNRSDARFCLSKSEFEEGVVKILGEVIEMRRTRKEV